MFYVLSIILFLATDQISKYFTGKEYISLHDYITRLVIKNDKKAQISSKIKLVAVL